MRRVGHLFEILVSDKNLGQAIDEVNKSHRWKSHHIPNSCVAWIEETKQERIKDLRNIIVNGYVPKTAKVRERYDASARKSRIITEPALWPDQYVHHALIQVLQPIMMRGMDHYCCGSIRTRGSHYAKKAIQKWVRTDTKGTKYCLTCDIYHFYDSIRPSSIIVRMRHLVKDYKVLDLVERIIENGIDIGNYTSQWFANVYLQPLDQLIRQSKLSKHFVRYMDNFTIFGNNKRKLHKLRIIIATWLNEQGLKLKEDWQVFATEWTDRGTKRGRKPYAVGFRYGRDYTLPRKYNYFRMKRYVAKYRKMKARGQKVSFRFAAGLLSRLGQLTHCNNQNLYRALFKGEKIVRELKQIVRTHQKEKLFSWEEYMQTRRERAA